MCKGMDDQVYSNRMNGEEKGQHGTREEDLTGQYRSQRMNERTKEKIIEE